MTNQVVVDNPDQLVVDFALWALAYIGLDSG